MYEPLYRHRPSHRHTHGDLAAKVGADIGLPPDPEQQWILDSIYAERAPDRPAAFEVGVIGPRQNIKTGAVVEVRDDKAEALGAEWQPVEVKKEPAKKSASSKSSK